MGNAYFSRSMRRFRMVSAYFAGFVKIFRMGFGLVYWGLTPQQQPGSYQGGEMMMMKSVFWWRKPEYPVETTDLRQSNGEFPLSLNLTDWGWVKKCLDF